MMQATHDHAAVGGGWLEYQHNGKPIGRLSKDGRTWATHRSERVHYVRRHEGYGVQRGLLRALMAKGVEFVRLSETLINGLTHTYVVAVDLWWRLGTHDVLRAEDGAQVFMSLRQLRRFGSSQNG